MHTISESFVNTLLMDMKGKGHDVSLKATLLEAVLRQLLLYMKTSGKPVSESIDFIQRTAVLQQYTRLSAMITDVDEELLDGMNGTDAFLILKKTIDEMIEEMQKQDSATVN